MDFEVVVVYLDTEENCEGTYQDGTQCRLTPSIFQSDTCRMQGGVATARLFRMPGLYLGVHEVVFAYRGHINLSFS